MLVGVEKWGLFLNADLADQADVGGSARLVSFRVNWWFQFFLEALKPRTHTKRHEKKIRTTNHTKHTKRVIEISDPLESA